MQDQGELANARRLASAPGRFGTGAEGDRLGGAHDSAGFAHCDGAARREGPPDRLGVASSIL